MVIGDLGFNSFGGKVGLTVGAVADTNDASVTALFCVIAITGRPRWSVLPVAVSWS